MEEKVKQALIETLEELEKYMIEKEMKFKVNPKWFVKKVFEKLEDK